MRFSGLQNQALNTDYLRTNNLVPATTAWVSQSGLVIFRCHNMEHEHNRKWMVGEAAKWNDLGSSCQHLVRQTSAGGTLYGRAGWIQNQQQLDQAGLGESATAVGDVVGGTWETKESAYCHTGWGSAWGQRTKKSLDECKASCVATSGCTTITTGMWRGQGPYCMLCTSEVFGRAGWTTTYVFTPILETGAPTSAPTPVPTPDVTSHVSGISVEFWPAPEPWWCAECPRGFSPFGATLCKSADRFVSTVASLRCDEWCSLQPTATEGDCGSNPCCARSRCAAGKQLTDAGFLRAY